VTATAPLREWRHLGFVIALYANRLEYRAPLAPPLVLPLRTIVSVRDAGLLRDALDVRTAGGERHRLVARPKHEIRDAIAAALT
jgi:hypothetical protein